MINRRRFFIGGSMALVGAITLSKLRPLLASGDQLPADLLISARKRNRFSVPTDDQFTKADASTRSSGSLQDLRADFDVDSAPDFAQNFVIGVDNRLISAVPIVDRNRRNQGSVHVSVLDRVSHQEVESIGWVIRPQGQNYRAIVKKDRKRFMDITIDPNGNIIKGYIEDGRQRQDLSGKNFVSQGNAAIASVIEDLKESATQARLPGQNINLANRSKSDKSIFIESESNLLAAAGKLDCVNTCLSNSGIPLYIITLLGAACGVACAITAGLGCIICASAVFGGALGVGASCLQRCGYRIR